MDVAMLLQEVARIALDAHEVATFAAEVTERICSELRLETCGLWLTSQDGQRLVQAASAGSEISRGPLSLDQSCAETEVFRSGEPHFTDNPDVVDSLACERSTHAVIPLRDAGRSIGVLVFVKCHDEHFAQAEGQHLQGIAAQVALGVSLIDLRNDHARRAELQAVFDAMGRSLLLTSTTPSDVLHNASVYLRDYFGGQAALAAVPEGQWWRVVTAPGYPPGVDGRRFHQTVMFGLSTAARNRTPLLASDDSRVSSALSANGRFQSAMIIPLVTPSGVAAALACCFEQRREFTAAEAQVAQQFSETVSLGFQNAVLRADEQEALVLADRMGALQTRLFSATEESSAMESALAKAAELVGAIACAFVIQNRRGWSFEHVADERGMFGFDEIRHEIHELLDVWTDRSGVRAYTSPTPALSLEDIWIAVAPVPDASPRAAIVSIRREGRFSVPRVNFLGNLARTMSLAAIDRRVRSDREWLASSRQQWLSGVSHDLRTPLSSIRGYAELLAAPVEVPPEEVQRQARIIADQTARIQALVEDMLLTFRIKEGALPVSAEPVDLFDVINLVAREAREDFRLDGADVVSVEGLPHEHLSRVDPHLLARALKNLVSNAIMHNPDGTRVVVRLSQAASAEYISVIDDGVGLDPSNLHRLWTRYARGDQPIGEGARNSEGIGLGMSVSRQLIEAMGGTIDVDSAPDRGTTFTIAFPSISSAIPA